MKDSIALILTFLLVISTSSCGGRPANTSGGPGAGDNAGMTEGEGTGGQAGDAGSTDASGGTVSLGDLSRGVHVWLDAGCTRCHRIGDDPGGDTGPSLTGVGDRYTKEELMRLIPNPRSVNPNATMPPQELSDENLEYLARYLSFLSSNTAANEERPPID